MRNIEFPNWLVWADKNLKWFSIPQLPLLLTIIQTVGFFLSMGRPSFVSSLVLYPSAVFGGEFWRIFTFIAIPLSNNFLVLFVLWFFYGIMTWLESVWGSTLLTVYFLVSWASTVLASLLVGIPVETFAYMECSFFFALATLNPNREIYLFFILPVAFKWIAGFIAIVLLAVPLFLGSYYQWIYMILLFANYLLFFGRDWWLRFKSELNRRKI
ncbi:hypothetical protein AGMMS49938_03370 [Fibrobacterales bacterium]|nr:hypothetical protein AGMMS49938_03370 [Fibrobacterales bacterium]